MHGEAAQITEWFNERKFPDALREHLRTRYIKHRHTYSDVMGGETARWQELGVSVLATFCRDGLPHWDLIIDSAGLSVWDYYRAWLKTLKKDQDHFAMAFTAGFKRSLKDLYVGIGIPDELRVRHHMIIANSGQGKTQCIQELLLHDLETDYPIVVIDSQGEILEKLMHVVEEDHLVYLDGNEPLAISPFNIGGTRDRARVTMALELFVNMFAALDDALTAKQATMFRSLSRLLMEIPHANFNVALDILNNGTEQYNVYVSRLSLGLQTYFRETFNNRKVSGERRSQVADRLYTVLDNPTIYEMFNAPVGKVDLGKAIRDRKVILINTAADTLGPMGAAVTRHKSTSLTARSLDAFWSRGVSAACVS